MSSVFREFYEVVGKAQQLAEEFNKKRQAATDSQWQVVIGLGAKGYRPNHNGGIKSLFFEGTKAPDGFRKIGTENGKIECVPSRNTLAGKAVVKLFATVPNVEDYRFFVDKFGWKPRSLVISGNMIHWPSGVRVSKPRIRTFLSFPRQLKDGWKPPKGLKEVRESDVLRAIEDHNARVDRSKVKK